MPNQSIYNPLRIQGLQASHLLPAALTNTCIPRTLALYGSLAGSRPARKNSIPPKPSRLESVTAPSTPRKSTSKLGPGAPTAPWLALIL